MNVVMIAFGLLVCPRFSSDPALEMRAWAWGALAGGLAQLLFQMPEAVKAGFAWRPSWPFGDPELRRVLRERIGLQPAAVDEIDEFLRGYEVAPRPATRAAVPKRDPDDQWVLASAIKSRVDVLVTGDRDLLEIAANGPIKIVDPRGFWDLVRKNE